MPFDAPVTTATFESSLPIVRLHLPLTHAAPFACTVLDQLSDWEVWFLHFADRAPVMLLEFLRIIDAAQMPSSWNAGSQLLRLVAR